MMRGKTIQTAFEQLLQVVFRDGRNVLDPDSRHHHNDYMVMEDGDG